MHPLKTALFILFSTTLFTACAAPPVPAPAPTPSPTLPMTSTAASYAVPLVSIDSGQLQGVRENNLAVFKGIPYAAPPVGELRWREPEPVAAWSGVRAANTFGNACIQPPGGPNALAGNIGPTSEDCLYLNVWTPNADAAAKLPVMVWIHGGALISGASSLPAYDGAPLATRGAVVVTFNYRLGALGFFAHPALDQADPNGPVNFGLLDEIAALHWVQNNIAAFGGDPQNVTIFGESAGAQSVLALFTSPLARGLFHRGIAESSYAVPSHPRADARNVGIQIATALGLNGAQATLQELRAIPADKFASLVKKDETLAPVFVAGDAALPEPIFDVFQQGKEAPLPLIIGNNSDEATVVIYFGVDPAKLIERLGVLNIAVRDLYPGVTDPNDLGRQLMRDLLFTAWTKEIATLHSQRAPSWRYYFSYLPASLRSQDPGVPHGGEIVFVMGTGDLAPQTKAIFTEPDRAMSQRVGDYWFAFARTGEPEPAGQPEWTPTTRANDETMQFGDTIQMETKWMQPRLNIFIGLLPILGDLLKRSGL